MTLNEHIDAFVSSYEGRDPSIVGRLQFWKDCLGHHELTDITPEMVDAELGKLMDRGAIRNVRGRGAVKTGKPLSGASLNRYLAAFASVIKSRKAKRKIPLGWRSPLTDIPGFPNGDGKIHFLTAEQVNKLVLHARDRHWRKLPALILMAFTTGLRRGALMGLRWKDIDLDLRTATVARTKNGSGHVARLTPDVVSELRRFGPGEPNELVFCGTKGPDRPHDFRVSFERALSEANLPRVTFHALRHSTATHLTKAGVSLLQVADVMAHKSLAMTRRYSHLNIQDRSNVIDAHFA